MSTTDLVGVALILFGLILAVLVYLVPYVRHKPAGLVAGVVIFVAGVALVSGAVQFGAAPAQIVPNHNVPAVTVQNVKAISSDTNLVSANSLNLKVDVTYNSTSKAIVAPAGGVVKFSFQLARTDTNTSKAIFDITSQNVMVANNTASSTSNADYLIQTYNNGTTNLDIAGNTEVTSSLISVDAASIVTVNVSATLSPTAIGNLYANGPSGVAAIGDSVNLGLIQVAGQTISLDVVIASVVS